MALFGKKRQAAGCDCGGTSDGNSKNIKQTNLAQDTGAAVKILGSGCRKCNELEINTKAALEHLGMDTTIDHITDFAVIAAYGVMTTPALVYNGRVLSYGKVLNTNDIVKLLPNSFGETDKTSEHL